MSKTLPSAQSQQSSNWRRMRSTATSGRKGTAETIRAISAAYLRFAYERPLIFALYLKTSGDPSKTPQCSRNTDFFLEQVTRVYGEQRAYEASHALWAYLHGIAVLRQAGVLSQKQESASLKFGLQMWINGAGPPSRETRLS